MHRAANGMVSFFVWLSNIPLRLSPTASFLLSSIEFYPKRLHRIPCVVQQDLISYTGFFFLVFAFSRGAPMAYGGSQARGLIGTVATSLHQSHSDIALDVTESLLS